MTDVYDSVDAAAGERVRAIIAANGQGARTPAAASAPPDVPHSSIAAANAAAARKVAAAHVR
jgi:hypothetical protein